MRKKLTTAATIVAMGLLVAGCNLSLQQLYQQAVSVIGVINASLSPARSFIENGCAFVYREEVRVDASPTCLQKVSKLRRGIEAICKNTALLTDDVAGNYVDKVQQAVFQAEKSGC